VKDREFLQQQVRKVVSHDAAVQRETAKLLCDLTFDTRTKPYKGPGSSAGIENAYGLDGPGIESRWGRDFPRLSRPALRPTQPSVK
jgi:hypothetical protein